MEKSKFTLRIKEEILKEMKIRAIHEGIALNELLINAYKLYKAVLDDKVGLHEVDVYPPDTLYVLEKIINDVIE